MKKNSHRPVAAIAFVIALLIAVLLVAILVISGPLGRIGLTSGVNDVVSASQETFERDTSAADTIRAEDVDLHADNIEIMQDNDVKNILLIGQDRRKGESRQRSDSMIICSINTKSKKIILTSLMRDMYVNIPGYSPNKMNAAYSFGGMNLLDEVIEQNFGIKLDGNVEVDFDGFVEALSVVGNIKINLTGEEAWYLNGGDWTDQGTTDNKGNWHLEEGEQELTPEQALAYSRIRYIGNSDWERTERQRRVIMAAFDKVKSSDLSTVLKVANKIFPYLTTDLSSSEILSYVKTIVVDKITTVESKRIPVDGYYSEQTIDGMSVLVPNLTMNSEYLQSYIYGTKVNEEDAANSYITVPSGGDVSDGDSGYSDQGTGTYDDGGSYGGDSSYSDSGYDDGTAGTTYTQDDGTTDDAGTDTSGYDGNAGTDDGYQTDTGEDTTTYDGGDGSDYSDTGTGDGTETGTDNGYAGEAAAGY